MSEKHAVYTGSRNLYPMMETAAKSLLAHTSVDHLWIFAEDHELGWTLPENCGTELHVVNIRNQKWFRKDGPNMKSRFTYFAMSRAAICHVLPEDVDLALALDVDTIFVDDADEVWDSLPNADRYYFAASKEWHRSKNGLLYCNIGVTLYNLAKLRDGKADEVIEVLNRRRYPWVEQDVFNYLCQGRIFPMDCKYNHNKFTTGGNDVAEPKIVHYAGQQSWENQPDYRYFEEMTWDEVIERRSRLWSF